MHFWSDCRARSRSARELDVVANNIANINTTGYKADGSLFEEYPQLGARAGATRPAAASASCATAAPGTTSSQGPIERTGNPLDVAIDGNAFLVVQTPRGERYTRNGALQINATGQLVTSDGDPVLGDGGPIMFQPTDHQVSISRDGTISVREGDIATSTRCAASCGWSASPIRSSCRRTAAALFNARRRRRSRSRHASRASSQGAIEKSNVRGVVEMSRMIEITRTYTQIASMLQQQNDLGQTAIDKLAEVPN